MRSRYTSSILLAFLVCLMVIPSVSADSVLCYAVSQDDCIYYHWTGNCTRDSRTVELDHIVYIDFIYGVPENASEHIPLIHYGLYFDNGTPIGWFAPGWPYNGTRPGIELVEPIGNPLAPLPIGNWTFLTLLFQNDYDITEDFLTWTARYNYSTRYYHITYSKYDGVVNHLIYARGTPGDYSTYYELTRIIDWTPLVVISIFGISGVICVVVIFRKRRIKITTNSNKEL